MSKLTKLSLVNCVFYDITFTYITISIINDLKPLCDFDL